MDELTALHAEAAAFTAALRGLPAPAWEQPPTSTPSRPGKDCAA